MLPRSAGLLFSRVITPAGEVLQQVGFKVSVGQRSRDIIRVLHLIRLDLKQQVFGLTLGHLWLILEPALMALAYYFLLTFIFRMQGADTTFASFLVAIIFWRSHAMLITSAPLFLSGKGYQYIDQGFGLNIAFLEFSTQELILFSIRFLVLLCFLVVAGYMPHISWLAGLFIAACMFSFTLALSIWLAIMGMFLKDIGKLVGHFVWLWWYLSPGLYSFGRIPEWAQPIFAINPFTYILPAAHSALLNYEFSSVQFLSNSLLAVISMVFMMLGWRLIKRLGYLVPHYV
jgi:lipopolysaccharide transport system permease protein